MNAGLRQGSGRARWPVLLAVCLALVTPAHAQQDPAMKDAVTAQQRRAGVPSEADLDHRLNRKLMALAKQFWLGAKADGLKFENVVDNIDKINAARETFGLPLRVIRREDSEEFAVTQRAGEGTPRAWVSLSGTSPDTGIDLTAIDGALVDGPTVTDGGGVDTACRYRVVFADDGEHDERGHDDYARSYPCIQFLTGALDQEVVGDLKRWAADLVRRAGQ
jgi:hypothetical protein